MVETQAEAALAAMERAYPVRDYGARAGRGQLVKGLKLDLFGDARSGTSGRIVNKAPHAWIFENGTGPRTWANGKSTGSMPPGKVFIPIAMRYRRLLESSLVDLVRRAGFSVSGMEG